MVGKQEALASVNAAPSSIFQVDWEAHVYSTWPTFVRFVALTLAASLHPANSTIAARAKNVQDITVPGTYAVTVKDELSGATGSALFVLQ